MFAELRAHVAALRGDDSVGCVVLRGAGKCFSAGHDLSDIAAGEAVPSRGWHSETLRLMEKLPKPVIAAVHGHCYTGALEVALACDYIIAADDARFGDTHAKWALTPVWGMSQRLPRRVGPYKAREMMFTCRTYSGREAAEIGLANICVPDNAFDAQLEALSAQILANSWFSHRANKRLLRDTDGLPLEAGLAREVYYGEGRGPDMEERIAGFSSKTVKQG
jgi:enoyl-CoA hydratase/carnithine racemase